MRLRTYDKLIATIRGRQGAAGLRTHLGVVLGPPFAVGPGKRVPAPAR
jgi:hypothetical protein